MPNHITSPNENEGCEEHGELLLRERPGEHFSSAVGPGTIVPQYFFIWMMLIPVNADRMLMHHEIAPFAC
jgi:hypothetical protein